MCSIIGVKKQLKRNVLPSYKYILLHYLWLDKFSKNTKCDDILNEILKIQENFQIPTKSKQHIKCLIKNLHNKLEIFLEKIE